MKIIQILMILVSFGIQSTFAQNDPDAETILKAISTKYKAYSTAKIDLKLTINIPETKDNVVTQGQAWLKKDMFKIEFDERMLVSNTVTQWTYLKEVNEVQISKYDPSSMIFLPSKIFDLYNDDYIYRIKEEFKNEKGELVKLIELTPVNKNLEIFKIIVSINMPKMEVVRSQIFEKSGMRYSYEILALKTNIKLEDSFFTFDPKAYGIAKDDITDLR